MITITNLRLLSAGATVAILATLLSAPASADSDLRDDWLATYPASASYQGSSCALCHASSSQFSRYNEYGYAIKVLIDQGASNTAAFLSVEGTDSDGDPTGSTNLAEIQAGAQPGWTPGPNNTTYNGGGNPTTGVTPPSSISGPLDPGTLGTNYCTPVANSTGQTGLMSATGSAAVSDNDVTLNASQLPTGAFGFFLTSQAQGAIPQPGGSQGVLCLSSAIGRYVGPGQIQNTGASGEFSLAIDLNQHPTPTGLVSVSAGETWNFTAWHRDSVGGTATSNFTDGLEITFQ